MNDSISSDILLLGFSEYAAPAQRLSRVLQCSYEQVEIHRFPDGESKVRLPEVLPRHLIVCRSLDDPNDKLIELLFIARTARAAGVRELTLVAPYLCYMRQDMAFQPGEAVSQHIIGQWLAELFDTVITVEPHLHRTRRLADILPAKRCVALSAGPLLADFLRHRIGKAVLVGPDEESKQWVEEIAERAGLEYLIAEKQRISDKDVHIKLPSTNLSGSPVIIIDDVASTARTLAVAAEQLRGAGATEIHCCITHAIFAQDAETVLNQAGIGFVWSTDSIVHPSNSVELSEVLAEAVRA